jgi:hypothetical protein
VLLYSHIHIIHTFIHSHTHTLTHYLLALPSLPSSHSVTQSLSHSVTQSLSPSMKFVVQLAAGFLRSVAASARKLLSLGRLDSGDLCVFCSTAFLAAGYFHPWCLIVAFVCLLPPLQQQLYLPEEGAGGEGGRAMTLEEELQSKILHEEKELAREMTTSSISGSGSGSGVETAAEGESEGGDTTPEAVKSRKKKEKRVKKEKKPVAEKPRVGKAQWGLPTLRVRDSEGRIIEINSEKPVAVETEYFKGTILMMLRTDGDLEEYNRYEHHFNGKQRKFEVQFQVFSLNCFVCEVMLVLHQLLTSCLI